MKRIISSILLCAVVISSPGEMSIYAESGETSEILYNENFDFESNTNWKSMYIATWKNGIVKDVLGNDKFVADPTNSENKVMSVNAIAGDGTNGSDGGYANIFSTPITVDQKKNVIIDAKVYINDDSESNDFIMLTPILDQGKIWGSTTVYPTPSFMFGKGSIGATNTAGKNLRLRVGAEASSEALKTIDEPAQYPQDYYANGTSAGAFVNSVSTTTDWQNNITMPVKQWVNLRYVMNPETNTVRIYLGTTENDMQPISMSYYYNDEKTSYPVSDRKQHYDFFPYEGDRANASYMPGSVTMPSVDNNTHKTFEKIYGLTSFTRGSNSNFYVDDIKIYQPYKKFSILMEESNIKSSDDKSISVK